MEMLRQHRVWSFQPAVSPHGGGHCKQPSRKKKDGRNGVPYRPSQVASRICSGFADFLAGLHRAFDLQCLVRVPKQLNCTWLAHVCPPFYGFSESGYCRSAACRLRPVHPRNVECSHQGCATSTSALARARTTLYVDISDLESSAPKHSSSINTSAFDSRARARNTRLLSPSESCQPDSPTA